MRKFPWKGLAIGGGILTLLVAIRSFVTIERAAYFGKQYGVQLVMQDPWLYIGMAAAALCVVALLVLADQEKKSVKIDQTKDQKAEPVPVKTSKAVSILVAMLCVATVFLSFLVISLNNKYEKQLKKQEEILAYISSQQGKIKNQQDEIDGQKTEIGKQNEVIQSQADAIAKLQELIANGVLDSTGRTTAADLLEMLEKHELTLQNQDELIGELKALLEKQPEEGIVTFRAYTVVAGDSLSKICAANNLDYGANYKIILAINGIKDANQIYVGQTILLPIRTDTN